MPPSNPACATGVLYFNNVGVLGMCGHGTIGVVSTLAFLGRIHPGRHLIETPVGIVSAELRNDGSVVIENVPSHRSKAGIAIDVHRLWPHRRRVAWGGNGSSSLVTMAFN